MPNYGEKKYWEERYESQKGKTFDWLEDYNSLNPIIKSLGIKKDAFILNVGCGNSEFSEKMFNDGFINNYNIDICENVINYMKERNKDKKGLHYQAMDVRDMKDFQDETFDLIIDKSTLDALLCGEKSFVNVVLMTKEISRILKTGGIYFIISYGRPEYRLFHLQRKHLAFDINFSLADLHTFVVEQFQFFIQFILFIGHHSSACTTVLANITNAIAFMIPSRYN